MADENNTTGLGWGPLVGMSPGESVAQRALGTYFPKHPTADNTLDKEAEKAAEAGLPSTGTADEIAKPKAAEQESPKKAEREGVVQPPQVEAAGGGSSSGGSSALSSVVAGFGDQSAALDEEKAARKNYATEVGDKLGEQADEERSGALASQAQALDTQTKAQQQIDEIHQLVSDYANGHIDKDAWWTEKSVPQKIGAVVGAIAAGMTGRPQEAANFVNGMIDRSINLQQEEIHRKGAAAMEANNLLYSFLKTSGNYQEAMDKTRMAMLHAAMTEVQQAAVVAQSPIEAAKIDEMKAALETQLSVLGMKMSGAGAGGGGPMDSLEVDPKTLYSDPSTGQSYHMANPADVSSLMPVMMGFNRILEVVRQGRALLAARKQQESDPVGWLSANRPYSDTIVAGEQLRADALGAAAKLEGARGVPQGISHMVEQMLPDFGSRFASLSEKKLDMAENVITNYRDMALREHGASPINVVWASGHGKKAGQAVPYAVGGIGAPMQPSATPPQQAFTDQAARNKIDYQPRGQ